MSTNIVIFFFLSLFCCCSWSFVISPTTTTRRRRSTINKYPIVESTKRGTKLFEGNDVANLIESMAESVSTLKDCTIVVKYGGNAMTSPELATLFCQDVATLVRLGIKVVVVHGGGPQISKLLTDLKVETTFAPSGLRISTPEVVDVAEMVLSGDVNKDVVAGICAAGVPALGISGRDGQLLQCIPEPPKEDDGVDLGLVGRVQIVNTKVLQNLLSMGYTPVVAPIGCGLATSSEQEEKTRSYNVNADVAAGRIAGELGAARVFFLTDIAGVLNKDKDLLPALSCQDISDLIQDGTITGGMIPKVSHATGAVQLGVPSAVICDGRIPHALLLQVLQADKTGGGGTIVTL